MDKQTDGRMDVHRGPGRQSKEEARLNKASSSFFFFFPHHLSLSSLLFSPVAWRTRNVMAKKAEGREGEAKSDLLLPSYSEMAISRGKRKEERQEGRKIRSQMFFIKQICSISSSHLASLRRSKIFQGSAASLIIIVVNLSIIFRLAGWLALNIDCSRRRRGRPLV